MAHGSSGDGSGWNERIIAEFREHNGKVGGPFEGASLLLIITAGAKSGQPRTNPLVYLRDKGRYLIFGSNLGGPKHPDWYHNILAHPQVTIELGTDEGRVKPFAARAVVLEGEERDQLYERQCAIDPTFRDYQAKTTRTIPVVALSPLSFAKMTPGTRMIGDQLIQHHNALRAELGRVRAEIDGIIAGRPTAEASARPPMALADQLREHCLSFCYGLQLHHIRENGSFTAFEEQFPHLVPAITKLRAEHVVVERALDGLETLLHQGISADASDVEKLRAELDQVIDGLEEHFTYEEENLLPALKLARPAG